MDVANELVWKDAGLFDQVDSVGLCTVTLNTSSKLAQQPPLTHTSLSTKHTFSFAECLHPTAIFPESTKHCSGSLIQGTKDKVEHSYNGLKESGKGSEVPGYSHRLWKVKKAIHKILARM